MNYNKRRKTELAAVLMSLIILISGCSEAVEEVPELLEPVSVNVSYRPVERGDIGSVDVMTGTVVPVDYCHFFHTQATISSIVVDVGDYVNAGDVLAYADMDAANEQLEELTCALELSNQVYAENCGIYDDKLKELEIKLKECQEKGDSEEAESIEKEISTEEENRYYDELLQNYRTEKLNQQIEEARELVAGGTLVARESGYVSYVADISVSRDVAAGENLVVISDESELYIELQGINLDEYKYEDYPVKYAVINGKSYDIQEISYSQDELIYAKITGNYPYVRIKKPEGAELNAGETVPVYYCSQDKQDVLVVGNDSLNADGDTTYVYVKSDDEAGTERRDITVGASDDNYTEVLDGLEEGELVYYSSSSAMPADYGEYQVKKGEFSTTLSTQSYSMAESSYIITKSDYSATVDSIAVVKGTEVKKGDLILTLDTGGGRAALEEASNAIKHAEENYAQTVKDYDASIAELNNQISELEKSAVDTALTTDAAIATDIDLATQTDATMDMQEGEGSQEAENTYDKETQREIFQCEISIIAHQKNISELEYNDNMKSLKKTYDEISCNNDGAGKINIYAAADGTLADIKVSDGDNVNQGDVLFSLSYVSGKKLLVKMVSTNEIGGGSLKAASLGQTITFSTDGKTYTGRCVGMCGNDYAYYLSTIDGEVYSTYSPYTGGIKLQFYVVMDDEEFYDQMPAANISFEGYFMQDVITIPENMIYTEYDKSTNKEYSYVWRVVSDELVKQYVIPSDSLKNNGQVVILKGLSDGDILAGGE